LHTNDSKQFLKIPKNWQGVRWENRNIYIAYLWVKRYSRFGRVHISALPKKHFGHWIIKLLSVGFMRREGDYYVLIGYEKVWCILGIGKVKFKGGKRYRFHRVLDCSTWSFFKKKLIDDIQGFQTERKKAQFRRRLNYAGVSTDVKYRPLFSSESAAKLFGYKSRTSGSKYRDKLFDVVQEPTVLRLHYTSDRYPYFKFDCKRVDLRVIFHPAG